MDVNTFKKMLSDWQKVSHKHPLPWVYMNLTESEYYKLLNALTDKQEEDILTALDIAFAMLWIAVFAIGVMIVLFVLKMLFQ